MIFYLITFICSSWATTLEDLKKLTYKELDSLLRIPYKNGDYMGCLLYLQAGRDKALAEFGELDTTTAFFTASLGYILEKVGQFKQAEHHQLNALKIRKELHGEYHPDYLISLNNLAGLYESTGRYLEAEKYYKQVIKYRFKTFGSDHLKYATALNNLGFLYRSMGLFEQAEPIYLQAIKVFKSLEDQKYYCTALSNLAYIYSEMGLNKEAENLFFESLKIRKQIFGEQHNEYAKILNNLGLFYLHSKQYKKAEPLLKKSASIQKTYYNQPFNYAITLNNLGGVYKNLKEYEQAEIYYIESNKLYRDLLGAEHRKLATNTRNLGALYIEKGEFDKADSLLLNALNMYRRYMHDQHFRITGTLNLLAKSNLKRKNIEKSIAYCMQAIQASSQLQFNYEIGTKWIQMLFDHEFASTKYIDQMLKTLSILFEAYDQLNLVESQIQIIDLAIHLIQKIKSSYISNSDKLSILEQSHEWMQRGLGKLSVNINHEKFFRLMELHKSVLLMEQTRSNQAYQLGNLPDSIYIKEKYLQKRKGEFEAKLLEKRSISEKDNYRAQLNEINIELKLLQDRISKDYPKFAAFKYTHSIPRIAKLQQNLKSNEALISFVVGDSISYIWYCNALMTKVVPLNIPKDMLDYNVEKLRETLTDYQLVTLDPGRSYWQFTEHAYWCYEQLIKPIQSLLQGKDQLIIIPEGSLGHLPFETFLTSKPKFKTKYNDLPYLIKQYTISYHYSVTQWLASKISLQNSANYDVLALAGNYNSKVIPNYNNRLPVYQSLRKKLKKLPAAELEVERLSQIFNGYFGFGFDSLSNERWFKTNAHQYKLIHLALHGMLNPNNAMLSSLVFSEDGDSTENNFLQAYEVARLNLNAELVVLSACESGYGKFEKGNGMASLARAFMYAGSRSLVVTLWQIYDYETAELMNNFYQNLADEQNMSDALRIAKLNYLKQSKGNKSHPA